MLEWVKAHREKLVGHNLLATGTTGNLLENELKIPIQRLQSGPLGGDQQIGALIAEQKIDILIFFWDPLEPQPHDPDVKALLRLAVAWNIPAASNVSSADFLINSVCFSGKYTRRIPDYSNHLNRKL